ncbi:MAG: hypothetical protein HC852_22615 [Acaryochloridaceae cyanobacterium RU_4_10]|nr:hypothetical protein [Acaryochloridaceae cyanobacterium RU_4_10]
MPVTFTAAEIARIPLEIQPLIQEFPLSFDNLFDVINLPPIEEPIISKDIYFDDDLEPAVGLKLNGQVLSSKSTDRPKIITVFANNQCGFVQALGLVLVDRIEDKSVLFNDL